MATQLPLEPDLFSDLEREVASILLETSRIILESAPEVPFEKVRWGIRKRRTGPKYEFKPEPDPEPVGSTSSNDEEKKKEGEQTASPATPLCFPNSSSEEQIATPTVKQAKKSNCQRDRLKEKKEQVAALTKEKADLNREFLELQQKFQMLCAMKFHLRNQHSKLLAQAELGALNQLRPVGPTQSTSRSKIVIRPPQRAAPTSPFVPPPMIERRGLEIDLNEKPSDDAAAFAAEAPLTCRSDREQKAAMSALARKRRLVIQRERKSTSSAQKRPRAQ